MNRREQREFAENAMCSLVLAARKPGDFPRMLAFFTNEVIRALDEEGLKLYAKHLRAIITKIELRTYHPQREELTMQGSQRTSS